MKQHIITTMSGTLLLMLLRAVPLSEAVPQVGELGEDYNGLEGYYDDLPEPRALKERIGETDTLQTEKTSISSCPNYNFEYKHVCAACNTDKEAFAFTRAHQGIWNTKIPFNTVFRGDGIIYVPDAYQNENSCRIETAVPTWKCIHNQRGYWINCRSIGNCTAQSARTDGHLFPESLDCQ